MRINQNKVAFALARDLLQEGESVRIIVRGQSMLPFFQSGSTITLYPICDEQMRRGSVVLGETPTGLFVVHRIYRIEGDEVTLLGDGNVVGMEQMTRDKIYGFVPCGKVHRFFAEIWMRIRPLRVYPLWILKRICRK